MIDPEHADLEAHLVAGPFVVDHAASFAWPHLEASTTVCEACVVLDAQVRRPTVDVLVERARAGGRS